MHTVVRSAGYVLFLAKEKNFTLKKHKNGSKYIHNSAGNFVAKDAFVY